MNDQGWMQRAFDAANNHLVLSDLAQHGVSRTVDRLEILDEATGKQYIFTGVKLHAQADNSGCMLKISLERWDNENLG